ncbi:hypothetical protein RSSM_03265 [Rhodopirellula sallentina SM41]|uniref:Uncharacterized protein n=1 Tax=Rhodopirellula sallentina SM41 TaxID=1263870 RepID=M5UH03_9BACT|nr:hypothetical protein RSSM_03265 [Rhodopirellula sallentina SM41]
MRLTPAHNTRHHPTEKEGTSPFSHLKPITAQLRTFLKTKCPAQRTIPL